MLKLRELRKKCGLTMKELGVKIGVAESTISQYETGKRQPDYETLLKLADFFEVPISFFLNQPPFDCWELIDKNRKGFFQYVDIPSDVLRLIWGIDPHNPDKASNKDLINFLSSTVESVETNDDGDWIIHFKPEYANIIKKTPTQEGEPKIINPDIRMIARAGRKMTPEQAENLRKYAEFMFPEAFEDDDT